MTRLSARPIAIYTALLATIVTVCGVAATITFQQMLRRGANQPQIQMAQGYASALQSGSAIDQLLPPAHIDVENSLEPFAIFYDADGQPLRATGELDASVPKPPHGVFSYTRTQQIEKLTWQPRSGVRIAAVVQRVDGPHPGFILVGRSLRLVEQQEIMFWRMAVAIWIALLTVLAGGAIFLERAQRPRPQPAAA